MVRFHHPERVYQVVGHRVGTHGGPPRPHILRVCKLHNVDLCACSCSRCSTAEPRVPASSQVSRCRYLAMYKARPWLLKIYVPILCYVVVTLIIFIEARIAYAFATENI